MPQHQKFFRKGLKFRAPPVLPTSHTKSIAQRFARNSSPRLEKIIWTFKFPDLCSHVNCINRRAPGVPAEDEWLFAAYSAFEVLEAKWNAGTDRDPHEVELRVMPDNIDESEVLPCSPWA